MLINNEVARITYLPESHLFAYLETTYSDELEWRANGNPHDLTPAELVAELESDQYDPLNHDWNGIEDSELTPMWADLAYPLPSDAGELSEAYGTTPSDIAREALREYANMYDVGELAERVLKRLRDEYDEENAGNESV